MRELSNFFKEKARLELGEDERLKKECVDYLIKWFESHPFIVGKKPDDRLFITILRSKKYDLDKVCKSFETSMIYYKSNPEYNNLNDSQLESFLGDCNRVFRVSKYRDNDGRRTIVAKMKEVEALELTVKKFVKMILIFSGGLLNEEELQIVGVSIIVDCNGVTLSYIRKHSIAEMIDFVSKIKAFPARIKNVIVVGLPALAVGIYHAIRNILPKKIQDRYNLVTQLCEINHYFDASTLLTEDKSEYNEDNFICIDEDVIKVYNIIEKLGVDFEKLRISREFGNYRMLEVD